MWGERKNRGNPVPDELQNSVREPSVLKTRTPYTDRWEYMADCCALIDYRLYLYYKKHMWLGPNSDLKNMLGLVVSREEFEHNLVKAAETGLIGAVSADEKKQIIHGEALVRDRLAVSRCELPLLTLFDRFGLDEFEKNAITLAYTVKFDAKYERLFAYLQDDITKKEPTAALCVQLYMPENCAPEEYMARFAQNSLFTSLFDEEALKGGALRLVKEAAEFLSTGSVTPPVGMSVFDGANDASEFNLIGRKEEFNAISSAVRSGVGAVALTGTKGSGRRFLIKHVMAATGNTCVFSDMQAQDKKPEAVARTALIARLLGAYAAYCHLDERNAEGVLEQSSAALIDAIEKTHAYKEPVFLTSDKPINRQIRSVIKDVAIPDATMSERVELFGGYFSDIATEDDVSVHELAAKFRFTPLQIKRAADQTAGLCEVEGVPAGNALIHKCCYRQVVHKLDKLAMRITPKFTWDDVVLPVEQKRLMKQACSHIRFQHKVYTEWGFDRKIGYGKGLSVLFAGAPGTGKTMCAQVMARQLNMEMYRINISQVVSKYIGETEKNLQEVFAEARNSNCILFFDECDAIFGKRSEVKDAHDRNANVEVAYLLQQIEDHDGVCVLSTNLIQNIDAAFMRRITYVVHFPFPEAVQRKEIYMRTIPVEAPVAENVDWDFLSEKFEISGGHIKNVVLAAAFMAAERDVPIGMRELLNAAVNELKKNEIVVVKEELREYADLIEN